MSGVCFTTIQEKCERHETALANIKNHEKNVDGHRVFIILSLYFCKCLKIFHYKVQKKIQQTSKAEEVGR